MSDTDLDVVLHLGDYIYEYPEGNGYANDYARNVLKRNVVPEHEVLALEDYRMRYGLYRTDPDLQAVHQRHPFICVWDDHELANNTWKDGAQNHNDGEGIFINVCGQLVKPTTSGCRFEHTKVAIKDRSIVAFRSVI